MTDIDDDLFLQIIDFLPCHVYWKDKNGKYLGCNQEHVDTLGYETKQSIIGKTDYDLPWKDKGDEVTKIDRDVMNSEKTKIFEERSTLPGADKETVYLSQKRPMRNKQGDIIGIIGVSLNVTELKEAQVKTEEALKFAAEAERRRRQFLSNQEHDINTALTGIIYGGMGFQMLDGSEDSADVAESADMIVKSAQRLQAYNRSLLKGLSWLDNEGKLIERRADIRKTLTKLFDINCLAAKAKNNQFIFNEVSDAIPQYLMVDDIALFQCLQDLVSNAINFTQNGTITLSVELPKVYDKDSPVIAFYVKDTGRGIAPEHQRYIFEDYYKVLPSNQPDLIANRQADEDKGRGLGLALSLKKAQAMGGELHLEHSDIGEGSEFVLTVPLKPALNQGR